MTSFLELEEFEMENNRMSNGSLGDNDPTSSTKPLLTSEIEDITSADSVDGAPYPSTKSRNDASLSNVVNPDLTVVTFPAWRKHTAVAILFFVNLLNYMDRFTIAGVLIQIKEYYGINNAMAGLLQTVFIISYMLVAPLFGYLGDRYNRKVIMIFGITLWSGFTLVSSFILNPNLFSVFLLMRALVGIGEASYSTIAPTMIGDLFVGPKRTRMLSIFFFATPVGSGLGYIVGSKVSELLGGWWWALRVTPGLGLIAIILLMFFCPNPPRGGAEAKTQNENIDPKVKPSYWDDIKYLAKNKSFIFVTVGFTSMAFVMGCLTFWAPFYFAYAEIAIGALEPCVDESCDYSQIGFIFGVITCVGGIAGIWLGAEGAKRWRDSGTKNADPLVCAIGLFVGTVLLLIGVHVLLPSINAAWTFVFFAVLSLCVTWTLVGDMTLYVTEPNRRSSANAVMLLIGHLFGDAGSPYLIGLIADSLMVGKADTYMNKFITLQHAMYVTLFVCVMGGGGFLMASLFVVKDKEKVAKFVAGTSSSSSTSRVNSGDSQNSLPLNQVNRTVGNEVVVSINSEKKGNQKLDSPSSSTEESDEVDGSTTRLLD